MKTTQQIIAIAEKYFTAKTYLAVDYSEKETAKANGAKWDGAAKKWYIPSFQVPEQLSQFKNWGHLLGKTETIDVAFHITKFCEEQGVDKVAMNKFIAEAFQNLPSKAQGSIASRGSLADLIEFLVSISNENSVNVKVDDKKEREERYRHFAYEFKSRIKEEVRDEAKKASIKKLVEQYVETANEELINQAVKIANN